MHLRTTGWLFCQQVGYLDFIPTPEARLPCASEDKASTIISAISARHSTLIASCWRLLYNFGCISLPPWQFLAFYPNTALSVLWLGIDQWLCAGSLTEPSNYGKSDKNSCDRGQVSSKILRTWAELSYLAVPGWFRQSVCLLTSQPRALHCYYYYCCCTPPVCDKALHCMEPWEKAPQYPLKQAFISWIITRLHQNSRLMQGSVGELQCIYSETSEDLTLWAKKDEKFY